MDCVRQRIATSENVEPVTRTACAAWRRTPSSAAAATSRPTAPATAPCVATTFAGSLFTSSSTTHCVAYDLTLKMRWVYAEALYKADGATLDDLREAVTTLAETERTARRVLGGSHPLTIVIEHDLRVFRANAPPPRA